MGVVMTATPRTERIGVAGTNIMLANADHITTVQIAEGTADEFGPRIVIWVDGEPVGFIRLDKKGRVSMGILDSTEIIVAQASDLPEIPF